jgi:hypothetical protein
MYLLITTLLAAGWTKPADSDGTTYSAIGTQVTSGGSGANGFNNFSTWIRVRAPAVNGQNREFVFQRSGGGDGRFWRIKYSAGAGFTGGSPTATVTPSAADEQILTGGGTDALPSYSFFLDYDAGGFRANCCCGGAAENYSFYMFTTITGTNNLGGGIMLDVMVAGSYPASDPDPAVVYVSTSNAAGTPFATSGYLGNVSGNSLNETTSPMHTRAWLGPTNVTTNFRTVAAQAYANTIGGTNGSGSNPFTGNDDLLPTWWIRPGTSVAPNGLKGCSSMLLAGSVRRSNLDTADVASAGAKDHVAVGQVNASCFWLPWNGTVPLV